jgi:hypothetical protein
MLEGEVAIVFSFDWTWAITTEVGWFLLELIMVHCEVHMVKTACSESSSIKVQLEIDLNGNFVVPELDQIVMLLYQS